MGEEKEEKEVEMNSKGFPALLDEEDDLRREYFYGGSLMAIRSSVVVRRIAF